MKQGIASGKRIHSQTAHTPGPWTFDNHIIGDGMRVFVPHTAGNDQHDAICDLETWQTEQATKANACLIAAAPELLQALKDTLRCLEAHLDEACRDHNISHRDILCPCNAIEVESARAAIAKAEGRKEGGI